MIFPYAHAHVAAICLERIRRKFERIEFETDDGAKFSTSATFGIADMTPADIAQDALIELADRSLYAAKEEGRNCVVANGKKMA
jgi:diguanylate cyclase (GGDEF)-like protein